MPTKVQKVLGKKIIVPVDPLAAIKAKFARLKALRAELASLKAKYQEHDLLMSELLPLFIETQPDKFVINRSITIGTDKIRFTPHFFDEKKGLVLPKVWKSSAFETGTVS